MAVPKTTTWPLEPHTQTKHLILRAYLAAWLPIMSKWNRRLVFIDGFAGPGRYSGGEEGSPIIALRTALEHPGLNPDTEVNFLFIEAEKARADHLSAEIEHLRKERPFPKKFDFEVAHAKFEEKVSRLLTDLAGAKLAPTLAFIDPFGFEGLPMSLVAEVAKYPKCECLITFMYEPVNRFFEHPSPRIQEHLEGLFGTSEARSLVEFSGTPEERFERITSLYDVQLRTVARFKFVRTFTMINTGNRVEYLLFFGTNSEVGLSKMKAAMWKADPGEGCRFSDRTVSNQTTLLGPEPDFALLERLLCDRFKEKGFFDTGEVERFVLIDTPFLETHLRSKTLAPMERAKPARIEVKHASARKKCTYPAGTKIRFL